MPTAAELRRDALQIWRAGVDAVLPRRLVPQCLRVEGQSLLIGNDVIPLDAIRRIVVVGGGKAGAGMAEAVETALGPELMAEKQLGTGGSTSVGMLPFAPRKNATFAERKATILAGWVNVPADCVRPLQRIHLHAARPAGVNEPTAEGVAGSMEILRLVESLGPDDLCLCLISGGGSALMPAPVEGITLADKLALTRHLSAAGANIEQLNTVRKQLSRIKGGGLLRACRAGRLVSLIISDVLGDPLDMIASGPTVPDTSTPQAALEVLERFGAREAKIAPAAIEYLERASARDSSFSRRVHAAQVPGVDAGAKRENASAMQRARSRTSFSPTTPLPSLPRRKRPGGLATRSPPRARRIRKAKPEQVGRDLAEKALAMRAAPSVGPTCLISGGEPVVKLVESSHRGLGGRNQQLVLAALLRLFDDGAEGIALLSGGTDGEDGPTDAAGAFLDADVLAAARQRKLDPADFLARNDAYRFFEPLGALIKTGPTQTNVCDVRVAICVAKPQAAG